MADYGGVYFSCFVCMSVYGVYTPVGQTSIYARACCVRYPNDGNRSGEEQERTVVDRILTMFKTVTWQELSL